MDIVAIGLVVTALLTLSGLTGLGEHRRGARVSVVAVAGLFFPLTWLVWYLKDEAPYRRLSRRVA